MKTQRILNAKSIYATAYLLIALFFFYLSSSSESLIPLRANMNWLYIIASILYLINWVYGAIYFPLMYRKALKSQKYDARLPEADWSWTRAYVTASFGVICFLFYIDWSKLSFVSTVYFFLVVLFWLAIHYGLSKLTRTSNLFKESSTMLDLKLFFPDVFDDDSEKYKNFGFGSYSRYYNLRYYYPVFSDTDFKEWSLIRGKYFIEHLKREAAKYEAAKESIRQSTNDAATVSKEIQQKMR